MKHLLFVSVALGIFSGTSLSATAQKSVKSKRSNQRIAAKKSAKFIEDIEIRPQSTTASLQPISTKNTEQDPVTEKNEASAIEACSSLQFKYAQLLNMDVEAAANTELYSFIEKWWATPYRYGGATKDGIDCSAYSGTLVHDVYGTVLSRTARSQYQECEKIRRGDLREGDLVFFKTRRGVSHVGVYLANGYFTHASTSSGVMISNLDEDYYRKKYIGAGRISVNTAQQ
jgi:lipoprotein Spr